MWIECKIGINDKILSLDIINKDYFEALNVSGRGFSKIIDNHKYIFEICILDNMLILTEDAYYVGNDNVYAYDWEGNSLWNVADIVGKKNIKYNGCVIGSINSVDGNYYKEEMFEDTDFVVGCVGDARSYIINPYTKKVLNVQVVK